MSDIHLASCKDQCCGGCGPNKVQPDICQESVKYFGCYPEGDYTVSVCGQCAWNHETDWGFSSGDAPSDAWVGMMYGQDDSTVPDQSQHAYAIISGSNLFFFGTDSLGFGPGSVVSISAASQPTGRGFTTQAAASASCSSAWVKFHHYGGLIGIRLRDNSYENNCGGGNACTSTSCGTSSYPTPSFGVSPDNGLRYQFTPGATCSWMQEFLGGLKRYAMTFHFDSLCPYTGAVFTLDVNAPTNQILSPTVVTQDITSGANEVTMYFDLRDESNKCFTAKLTMSEGTDAWGRDHVLDGLFMEYDLTPVISLGFTAATFNPGYCASNPQNADIYFNLDNGLTPLMENGACNMSATMTGADLASYVDRLNSCSAPPLQGDSGPWCGSTDSGAIHPSFNTTSTTPASIDLDITLTVGVCELPPLTLTLPLSW